MSVYFSNSSIFIKAPGYQKVVREFHKSSPVRSISSSSSSATQPPPASSSISFNMKLPAYLPMRYDKHGDGGTVCSKHKDYQWILYRAQMGANSLTYAARTGGPIAFSLPSPWTVYSKCHGAKSMHRISCILCACMRTVSTALNFDPLVPSWVCAMPVLCVQMKPKRSAKVGI